MLKHYQDWNQLLDPLEDDIISVQERFVEIINHVNEGTIRERAQIRARYAIKIMNASVYGRFGNANFLNSK